MTGVAGMGGCGPGWQHRRGAVTGPTRYQRRTGRYNPTGSSRGSRSYVMYIGDRRPLKRRQRRSSAGDRGSFRINWSLGREGSSADLRTVSAEVNCVGMLPSRHCTIAQGFFWAIFVWRRPGEDFDGL